MPSIVLAEIAQLVEQCTENAWVLSSSLSLGTTSASQRVERAGVVQLVEHLLAKEKVVGSSPIARSGYRDEVAYRKASSVSAIGDLL